MFSRLSRKAAVAALFSIFFCSTFFFPSLRAQIDQIRPFFPIQHLTHNGNCGNAGFELGSSEGYETFHGSIDGDGNVVIDQPGPIGNQHRVVSVTEGNDPIAAANCIINSELPMVPPGAGQYAMRLGNASGGRRAERVLLEFEVTPERAFFLLSYAVVLNDPGHQPFQQPRFELRILDENGDPFPCGEYLVRASGSIDGFENCGRWRVLPWTTAGFELQSYLGQTIQIEILTTDCSLGGHGGYAYFDASCQPLQLQLDGYCPNASSVNLLATAGFEDYAWSTGDSTAAITIQNPVPGTEYSVTVTSATGCSLVLTDTLPSVDSLPPPMFELVNDTTICPGNDFWFTPTGTNLNGVFSQNLGFLADSFLLAPLTSTEFIFTSVDSFGCNSDTLRFQVMIDSATDLVSLQSFTTDSTTCPESADGSIELVTDAHSIVWQGYSDTTARIENLSSGLYQVFLFDSLGCAITETIEVFAPPPMEIINVVTDQDACFDSGGGVISGQVSGGTSPYILLPNGDPLPANFQLFDLPGGQVALDVQDANGCIIFAEQEVGRLPSVIETMQTDSVRCNGESNGSISLDLVTASGPFDIQWNQGDIFGSTATDLAPGDYAFTITDAAGCIEEGVFTVSEPDPLLVTPLSMDSTSCHDSFDGSASVQTSGGNGGYVFSWSGQPLQTEDIANDLPGGSYTINVTDFKGCTASTALIIPTPEPLQLQALADSVSCAGGADGRINLLPGGGNGGYRFIWSDGLESESTLRTDLTAGVYALSLFDRKGCALSLSSLVEEPFPLMINTSEGTFANCQDSIPGRVEAIVSGGNGGYAYQWSNGQQTSFATAYVATNLEVVVEDRKGCQVNGIGFIPGFDPSLSISADRPDSTAIAVCAGTPVRLSAQGNRDVVGIDWLSESTDESCLNCLNWTVQPEETTRYFATVIDDLGCTDTVSLLLPVLMYSAQIDIVGRTTNYFETASVCYGESVEFMAQATPLALNYRWWNPSTGLDTFCLDCDRFSIRVRDFHPVELTVEHANGCVSYLDTLVLANERYECQQYIPNAFSPNADGVNDYFYLPSTLSVVDIPELSIYDRWGESVFHTTVNRIGDAQSGWDGNFRGRPAASGVYVYRITLVHFDGRVEQRSGELNLLR